ncbi:MAG: hexosaminidase [Cyclobacteriaceae bacterium]|jgi:hexosaminidase
MRIFLFDLTYPFTLRLIFSKFLVFLFIVIFSSCKEALQLVEVGVIPQPNSIELQSGAFEIDENTVVYSGISKDEKNIALELTDFFSKQFDLKLVTSNEAQSKGIQLKKINNAGTSGSYKLNINSQGVVIEGSTYQGIFYGVQTLKQLLTPGTKIKKPVLQYTTVEDAPEFGWRGMMLDVSRHFMSKDSVKKVIDILAMHKMNKFHWHLVDGIGWRIEISKYPELTKRGAWRKVKGDKKPWEDYESTYQNDEGEIYGGFYTKDDIREIVAYAASKYIDVIPEIEMPGHSDAATQCYSELLCKDAKGGGVYCAGNDHSYEFLQNILSEVIELFPYEYIHIGGDEVGKGNWLACSLCQKRMKDEGLKDGYELQSYFVKRMEEFIYSKDRKLMGWDEILEGGLPERAAVMSWRGVQGGIEASNAGHDVVMSPGSPCYFDHSQGKSEFEPPSWGGYNNLLKVYDFNPVPEDIKPEMTKHILGGQANLWTEQIPSLKHAQYMMLPRLSALAEALWTMPSQKDKKLFMVKIDEHFDRLAELGYNYATSSLSPDYNASFNKETESFSLELTNELNLHEIRYTIDGTMPDMSTSLYTDPIMYSTPIDLYAQTFRNGVKVGFPLIKQFSTQFSAKCEIGYKYPYNESYSGGGDRALFDNKFAIARGDDPNWQGVKKTNFEVAIDLGDVTTLSNISLNFFQHIAATSVMLPTNIVIQVSEDGEEYSEVLNKRLETIESRDPIIKLIESKFTEQKVGWIKIEATNRGKLPEWHIRQGDAWVFVDEISIK